MKAIEIQNPGKNSRLAIVDRPAPVPGPGQALIRVAAAGVNRADLLQRKGHYPPPPGASDLPGLEVSGEIVAVEGGAGLLQPGDRVCALLSGGGYAQYCLAEQTLCLPCPKHLDVTQSAGLPEACFTVWDNVFRRGKLTSGETLLIQGGTSGIGSLAIPLAKAFGAKVLATAGNEEKCRAIEALGGVAINYKTENLEERILALTQNLGVDAILDLNGGPYLEMHLKILKEEGRLILIAVQGGYRAEINLLPILTRRLTLTGSTLRSRSLEEKQHLSEEIRHLVWPLLESKDLKPTISKVFDFRSAEAAHDFMQEGSHIGKILIRFND